MEDSQIIELLFQRDENAISQLDIKFGRLCHQISKNILGNQPDAEECVNDAYLGVWDTVPPQNPNPLCTYVCRIVRNISITRYHKNKAKKRNSMYDVAIGELDVCLSSSETPETEYEAKELARMIEGYLDTLNKKDQALFVRRYWFSDSIGELAQQFHMKEANISVRLHRLRKELGVYLGKRGVKV